MKPFSLKIFLIKQFLLVIFVACVSIQSLKAQGVKYHHPKGTGVNCGAFVVVKISENKSIGDKAIKFGSVKGCIDGSKASYALVSIFNEAGKRIDTIRADVNGNYKKVITAGTYRVWAGQVATGSIETTFLDFMSHTATKLDLYLSVGPVLKD